MGSAKFERGVGVRRSDKTPPTRIWRESAARLMTDFDQQPSNRSLESIMQKLPHEGGAADLGERGIDGEDPLVHYRGLALLTHQTYC